MTSPAVPLVLAIALAAVHVLSGYLLFLRGIPRSWWLSLGGGVSVAYVFVHLLPEVTERQARVIEVTDHSGMLPLWTREHLLFLAVLAGFSLYYGVEQLARRSRQDPDEESEIQGEQTRTSREVFWVHMVAFGLYNLLVGYLLVHSERSGLLSAGFYVTALGLHFLVNDHGLREHHADAYDRVGRWLLAGAVVLGAVLGLRFVVDELLVGLFLAFLGGGIVLNVIKEELPEHRQSRVGAFATGVVGYTVVLLAL